MQALKTAPDRDKILAAVDDPGGSLAPGCAVALFRYGRSEFVFSGFADIAAGRRPNADTLYYAGSLAKQFTALAIIQLVVAGKVDLEDDVRRFLPEMAPRSSAISVEMLLHHTSGLPNYARLAPLAGYRQVSDLDRDTALRMVTAYPGAAFPPGASFEYSNGGYLLLSAIVERVTGTTFADYVKARILKPLGMQRSAVLWGALSDDSNRARGYMPDEQGFVISENVPTFGGAGAMMFTLNDLARYFHDITAGGKVWTPEVARLMTAPGLYSDGSPVILPVPGHIFGYAGGLMLSRDWILHGGNFAGFQAMFGWLPGRGCGLALLCNRGDVDPLKLATRVMAAVAPDLPGPDTQRFVLPGPTGRFVSDTLATTYEIEALEDETLEVRMTPPGSAPAATMVFEPAGDRVFASGPITLTFDPDRRGLESRTENVSIRFRRAS